MPKTVRDQVAEDIKSGTPIHERPPAPCVVCGQQKYLRYGCCLPCATTTSWDDPRVTKDVRVGNASSEN